jgi:RND family efflux transporter MFP subunit
MADWLFDIPGLRRLLPLALAGVFVVAGLGCDEGKGKRRGKRGKRGKRVFTVHLQTVKARTLSDDIVATGTTKPVREMYLSTQVGGSIIRYNVSLGRRVKKGDVLARVSTVGVYGDSRQALATIKRLKADIGQADQELKDTKKLYDQKVLSRKNYDDARYKLIRLQAQRAEARARLGAVGERYVGGVVRAPFGGIIAAQNAELGDYASPGKVLGHLVDMTTLKVMVSLAEVDMVRLEKTMPVRVSFAALGGRVWTGKIVAVAPTADKQTGAFPVEVRIDNRDGKVRGGMAARVVFGGAGIHGVFVPVEAVVRRGGKPVAYVLAVGTDKVRLSVCKVGLARDGLVQVLAGLKIGERLVVSGNTRLRDGSKVRVAGSMARAPKGSGGPRGSGTDGMGSGAASMRATSDSRKPVRGSTSQQ